MANLLSRLLNRRPDEVVRYSISDLLQQLANGRYGLTGNVYSPAVNYAKGRPVEAVENSYVGYVYGAYKQDPIVYACMTKRASIFSEARFLWREIKAGRPGDVFADDALSVLSRPWPNGTTGELLTRMIQDVDLAGNCYLINEGDRLRRLRPDWVQIILSGDPRTESDVDVVGYLYTPGGLDAGEGTPYLPDQICHWSPNPDPDALYRGMSWLTPVVREIQGDLAATDHKLAFFRNGATLGPIVRVPAGMTPAQFGEFIEKSEAAHSGTENAYRTMYIGGGADVTLAAADFRQMDFSTVQGKAETRICVAAQVPAVIAGVSEGLSGSSLNSGNYQSAKRSFVDGTLRPLWRSACAALSAIVDVPADAELWFDESDIAFLREDQQDAAQIQQLQMATIASGIVAGFEPDSVVMTVNPAWKGLTHSGLMSVQLLPPGQGTEPGMDAAPDVQEPDSQAVSEQARAIGTLAAVIERRFDPHQVRIPGGEDGGGRWTATGTLKDALKLADRIEVEPGQRLAGSSVVNSGDGGVIPMAWIRGEDGARLRIGVGISAEDQAGWRGRNLGSTVELDHPGVEELHAALTQMKEAGRAGRAHERELSAAADTLRSRQRELIHRQYPTLTSQQRTELDKLDERAADLDGHIPIVEGQLQAAIDALPDAAKAHWAQTQDRIGELKTQRDQILESFWAGGGTDRALLDQHSALSRQIEDLLNQQRSLHDLREKPGPGVKVGFRHLFERRQNELGQLNAERDGLAADREELTADATALSEPDAAELRRVGEELVAADDALYDLRDGHTLAYGTIGGTWGDLLYEASMTDTGPSYHVTVRPTNAPADWTADEATQLDDKHLDALIKAMVIGAPLSARDDEAEGLARASVEASDMIAPGWPPAEAARHPRGPGGKFGMVGAHSGATAVRATAGQDVTPGHDELHHYWTRGEGLAKWAESPQPWTTLEHLLEEHVAAEQAKRMAAAWFHEVFGFWPGSDLNRVAHGQPPRGDRVGPG